MESREMDKFDLEFLIDSEDTNLLYKHILEAICSNSHRIQDGINRYTIDQVIFHTLNTVILFNNKSNNTLGIRRIDKYVMEL